MTHRHTDHNQDHFDLLPFIAILMCTLGCLLLVTMSMASLSLGPRHGEGWIPVHDAMQPSKTPVLIEWDGTVARVHRDGQKVSIPWSASSGAQRFVVKDGQLVPLVEEQGGENVELRKFLEELATQRHTHYALFAVRPEGFASFLRFSNQFRAREINVGSMPLPSGKPVRLLRREVRHDTTPIP
jgi:hypothetical protein